MTNKKQNLFINTTLNIKHNWIHLHLFHKILDVKLYCLKTHVAEVSKGRSANKSMQENSTLIGKIIEE